jgi:mannan endo-1,4-beta-mannosidase
LATRLIFSIGPRFKLQASSFKSESHLKLPQHSRLTTQYFNDVSSKPVSGPYFQLCSIISFHPFLLIREKILSEGRAVISGGDGLQRLDNVVATADNYGLKFLLTLTNNWNAEHPMPDSPFSRRDNTDELPRVYLANNYSTFHRTVLYSRGIESPTGGMDLYIRNFHPGGTYDLFYTDQIIDDPFKNYLVQSSPICHTPDCPWTEIGE